MHPAVNKTPDLARLESLPFFSSLHIIITRLTAALLSFSFHLNIHLYRYGDVARNSRGHGNRAGHVRSLWHLDRGHGVRVEGGEGGEGEDGREREREKEKKRKEKKSWPYLKP